MLLIRLNARSCFQFVCLLLHTRIRILFPESPSCFSGDFRRSTFAASVIPASCYLSINYTRTLSPGGPTTPVWCVGLACHLSTVRECTAILMIDRMYLARMAENIFGS